MPTKNARAVSLLRARAAVGAILTDLGLGASSLDRLQATVLAGVIVTSALLVAAAAANAWLEAVAGKAAAGPSSLSEAAARARQVNCANWLVVLAVALALSGTVTWLSNMTTALSALEDGGGGGYGAATLLPAQPRPPVGAAAPTELGVLLAPRLPGAPIAYCPPGCVDLGVVAKLLGLPWPCFCSMGMLGGLIEQLHGVVRQLWVGLVGALLLFCAATWTFGYVCAQTAHAARDLAELLGGGGGLVGA